MAIDFKGLEALLATVDSNAGVASVVAEDKLLAAVPELLNELQRLRKDANINQKYIDELVEALHLAESERDEARAEVKAMRGILDELFETYDSASTEPSEMVVAYERYAALSAGHLDPTGDIWVTSPDGDGKETK